MDKHKQGPGFIIFKWFAAVAKRFVIREKSPCLLFAGSFCNHCSAMH